MTRIDRLAGAALRIPVLFYRFFVAPVLPAACRFEPSCSRYALEALTRHGALRGSYLAAMRILRCHPWGGEGYDPVPDPRRRAGGCAALHPHHE